MSTLINALTPLMNSQTDKFTLEVSGVSPDELQVVVRPMVGPVSDKASEELRQLKAALSQPIKVVGSADAIENALTDLIAEQAPKRAAWANRAAELDAAIAEAAAKDIKKGKAASSAKTAKATASSAPASTTVKPEPSIDDTSADDRPDDEIAAGFSL